MSFTEPAKTSDGRYYVKAFEKKLVQLNGVTLASSLADPASVTFTLDQASWDKISELNAVVLQAAKDNRELWFGRAVADKTLETAYVRPADTVNVSSVKGSKVFQNKEPIDPATVPEGAVCDVVFEFSGVWFAKKTFGPTWKLVQTRVRPPPKKRAYDEYLFADEEAGPSISSDDED